jgi:isopenicillin-N N-acyltransferase-like protein
MSVIEQQRQVVGRTFPFYRFRGTHRQIGEQYGEACAELIHRHRDLAVARLGEHARVDRHAALDRALEYRPFVLRYAAFFDDEIQGVAAGAGISLAEAYLLQLRAELATPIEPADECTSFAVQPEATSNGIGLAGQNADLPAFYGEISITAEITPDDMPAVLMVLPAGQVSYIGINDRGMGVFANFLTCDGWRMGLPRYFYSRLALTNQRVDDAIEQNQSVLRASSRNLLLLDASGTAADLETTPTADARLDPRDGLLAHSNHYVADTLQSEERSPAAYVANSRVRLERMQELLREQRGKLDALAMQSILRDRACHPDNLCRMPGDLESDVITFASVIAEPSEGRMWVAVGPPNEHEYTCLAFSS